MERISRNISIRGIIIIIFVISMLISIGSIGYLIMTRWLNSAEDITVKMTKEISDSIYDETYSFIHMSEYFNEINSKIIEMGLLDLSNEDIRDKFFVNALNTQDDDIYSFSYGSSIGEYYGARRNLSGDIEIMRNNNTTGGDTWYYSLNNEGSANELIHKAGQFDPRTRDWYKAAETLGEATFSPIYKHFVMDDLTISAAHPIYDSNHKLQGVMGTHMLLGNIGSYLSNAVDEYSGYAILFDKNSGELIANSMGMDNFSILPDNAVVRSNILDVKNISIQNAYEYYIENQIPSFLYENGSGNILVNIHEMHLVGFDWIIMTAIPEDLYMFSVRGSVLTTVLLVLFMTIISIIAYNIITKKLFKPMDDVMNATRDLSSGNLLRRIRIVRNDEIGMISSGINKVADKMEILVNNLEDTVKKRTDEIQSANINLEANKAELQLILNSTAEAIYGMDIEGKCTFCNKSCLELLGYSNKDQLLGKDMHTLIHHSKKDGTIFTIDLCRIYQSISLGKGFEADDEVFWRADGTSFEVEYHAYPQFKEGVVVGGVVTFMDITTRKLSEERIRYLSFHDPITGLYNLTFLQEEIERLDVERNYPFSIIVGDVNGLKLTNDVFGHKMGDELLKKIGKALKRSCRADDIVARVGGDEFVLLLPKTTSSDSDVIIKRIHEEVTREDFDIIKGSISLGKASKTKVGDDFIDLYKKAEEEMYRNKSLRQNDNGLDQLENIINSLHIKSEREKLHSENVSDLCEKIALKLDLAPEDIRIMKMAGYYHDIGKIALEDEALNNLGIINEKEQLELRKHSTVGYRILNLFSDTMDISKGALDHHEHWDGSGYPKGLKGEEISLKGRVVAIAESFDSWTNPFSVIVLSKADAIKEIKNSSGIKFDPKIVEAFLQVAF